MNELRFIEPLADELNTITMQPEHIGFVFELLQCDHNKAVLHGADLTMPEADKSGCRAVIA